MSGKAGSLIVITDFFLHFLPLPFCCVLTQPPVFVSSFHLSLHRKLFIRCVALPGVTEESWTEENKRAVDQFVVDTTLTTLVVYVDTDAKLRVEYSIPLLVQHSSRLTF